MLRWFGHVERMDGENDMIRGVIGAVSAIRVRVDLGEREIVSEIWKGEG